MVPVGTALSGRPPDGSQRAALPHWALTSGEWRRSVPLSATSRTRSSSLGAPCFRRCVQDAFCWLAFPLIRPLPSTASAPPPVARHGLFGDFAGNMDLSDFPYPCIVGLRSPTFPTRPSGLPPEGGDGISRFSRMEIPRMRGVCDRAGPDMHSPERACPCCLPNNATSSAP